MRIELGYRLTKGRGLRKSHGAGNDILTDGRTEMRPYFINDLACELGTRIEHDEQDVTDLKDRVQA